jgi:hypothetical protein
MLIIRTHACSDHAALKSWYETQLKENVFPTQLEADTQALLLGRGETLSMCFTVDPEILFNTTSQESIEQYVLDLKPTEGRKTKLFRCPKGVCPICLGTGARRKTQCGCGPFHKACVKGALRWSLKCPVCQQELKIF